MKLHFTGEVEEVLQGLSQLQTFRDFVLSQDGIPVRVEKARNGLGVFAQQREDELSYRITYSRPVEFFRGLSYLLDAVRNERTELSVQEAGCFETCGISVDLSRNAVLRVDTFKDLVKRIALMGLNAIVMYTEDTYRMEKYPYFGYMRGAYSREELREMVDYAALFGIEVIPNIQTLGHLESTLRWSYTNGMQDTKSVLLIDEPKTYEFIEEMFKTCRSCYKTDKIFIGMDEAQGVGSGNFMSLHGYEDRFSILQRHLGRVVALAEKYGFHARMSSDMFFRLGSKTGEYYDLEAQIPADIERKIPKELSMIYWDYYHEDESVYDTMIKNHKCLGRDIVFQGCVWTCNTYAINYGKTFAATKPGLASCRKNGIKEVFACLWGDDGTESSVYTALLGFQLYAEYHYNGNVSDENLRRMFKLCTGYDMDAFLMLDVDNFDVSQTQGIRQITVSKQLLVQDILQGLMDKSFEGLQLREHFQKTYEELCRVPEQGDLEYLFDYMRAYVKAVYKKSDLGSRLTRAYLSNDRQQMAELVEQIREAKAALTEFIEALAGVWYKNNKPFGFDRLDLRLGGVAARMDRAISRVEQYLSGQITCIEELEEERLIFNGVENPFAYRTFSEKFMTVSHPPFLVG